MTREAGFAGLGLVLAAALVTLVLAGIGVELWRVVSEHRRLSGLAEGAALSGATAVDLASLYAGIEDPLLDALEAERRACDYLSRYGGLVCATQAQVVVDRATIEVVVTGRLELTLLRLVASRATPIEVSASGFATALRSG
jgi:hypothetical protein